MNFWKLSCHARKSLVGAEMGIQSQISPEELYESVYNPPKAQARWRLEEILCDQQIRYFSYGRRALVEAFRLAGVASGDTVALPEFICREVLSALKVCGAVPSYYPVGLDLNPGIVPELLSNPKVVVAVNYFGFPQELASFRQHCCRTGAILIEDNAQGLFSRDENGAYLGTRGDIGVMSLRKTVGLPNGAVLLINACDSRFTLSTQEAFGDCEEPLSFRVKEALRKLVSLTGHRAVYRLISLVRFISHLRTWAHIRPSNSEAEETLPSPGNPCGVLSEPIAVSDPQLESIRRRALYSLIHRTFLNASIDIRPVFPKLPDHVVPYGYPFYARPSELYKIEALLKRLGLHCFNWPNLPEAIRAKPLEHYKNVWLVPFLW